MPDPAASRSRGAHPYVAGQHWWLMVRWGAPAGVALAVFGLS